MDENNHSSNFTTTLRFSAVITGQLKRNQFTTTLPLTLLTAMNTFFLSLLLTLTITTTLHATPALQPSHRDRPTRLARFDMGAYLIADQTKLRVNVEKQLGGWVSIQLVDPKGQVYFDHTLRPAETLVRLSLDLASLTDGDYMLNVSNGLEKIVRQIKITTPVPTTPTRSITVQP